MPKNVESLGTLTLDQEGNCRARLGLWTDPAILADQWGVPTDDIRECLFGVAESVSAVTAEGKDTVAYLRRVIMERAGHLMPRNPIRIYTKSGRRYASLRHISFIWEISKDYLQRRRDSVHRIKRNGADRYCIDDFEAKEDVHKKVNAEIEVDENGCYEDEIGTWITFKAYWKLLPEDVRGRTSYAAIFRQACRLCKSKKALNRNGVPDTEIFPLEDLEKHALALVNEGVRVDKTTGVYTSPEGEKYTTREYWQRLKKVTRGALDRGLKDTSYKTWDKVPTIDGLAASEAKAKLISETVIDEILAYIFQARRIIFSGIYTDIEGPTGKILGEYYTIPKLQRECDVSKTYVHQVLRGEECETTTAIDRKTGRERNVFNIETARELLRNHLSKVVETNEDGECIDPRRGRAITLTRYCEENPEIDDLTTKIAFWGEVESCQIAHLRRRDLRNRRIVTLYFVSDLDRIKAKFLEKRIAEAVLAQSGQ